MTVLQASPDAPYWLRLGADTLLYLHIGGGGIGIVSGAVALLTRKGDRIHRAAGTVFFFSMLIAYSVAVAVAPFLPDGQRTNTVAGIMALYLLISGWRTARRGEAAPGGIEIAGLFVALALTASGVVFIRMAANDPTGTIDGAPPQAFYIFATAGILGALGDLHLLVRRGLSGGARIARHLWRMCFSVFIASGSFFLGQQKVMPEWLQGSPALIVLALAPLVFMLVFLARTWIGDFLDKQNATDAARAKQPGRGF